MSSITTIAAGDLISTSRTDINTNFANLNSDKIETSVIDTDTSLTANSDSKIATQKAVKAYVDSGGQQNASETVRGLVEEATDAEVTAGTATGGTGAKLFVSAAKLATRLTALLAGYQATLTWKNGVTTYDMSTASGTQNIAHGLGKIPKQVRITAAWTNTTNNLSQSYGVYNGTTQSEAGHAFDVGNGYYVTYSSTSFSIELRKSGSVLQTGVITFDATNITITWTKTGSPTGTANIMWEAIG